MAKMKLQSWLLLVTLAIIVAFAAGIRQGVNVEKKNSKATHYYEVADHKCGVRYLLPDTVTQNLEPISINCDTQASGSAAMLAKQGYTSMDVASSSGSMQVWVRAPQELILLLQSTIRLIENGVK